MSELRQPRSIVTVNGGRMDFESWEVNNNGYYQADTSTVRFVLHPWQAEWWSKQTTLDVMIYDGFPKDAQKYAIADLNPRILGRTDSVDVDPVHRVVHVSGRDYTSKLIDTKVPPPNPNAKAYEVAIEYAALFGLDVGDSKYLDTKTGKIGKGSVTQTYTRIGTYYDIDHVNMKVEKSAWDILCYLAQNEQFIVYVKGKTLHFEPAPPPAKARIMVWDESTQIPSGPAPELHFIRNLTLSRGIIVNVRSWNHKHPKGFTVTARMQRTKDKVLKKNQPPTGEEQVYSYSIPGLSPDEAQQRARTLLASISQHEVRFTADDMPGDPTLDPFQPVQWKYNGTLFQQTYKLDSVVRSFSFHGYSMSLRGKNHSIESVVIL